MNRARAELAETSLRMAQKGLTRSRIREAARSLFYSQGYAATTVEQIAAASGASRATFYLHFKDKEEVLQDIARDYAPRAVAVCQRLPGPRPTQDEIRAWLGEFVTLIAAEQVSLNIFRQVSQGGAAAMPSHVREMVDQLIAALGERLPAFRAAMEPGPDQLEARVRADLLLTEATSVCNVAARDGGAYGAMALDVLAEHFRDFTSDRRFGGPRRRGG